MAEEESRAISAFGEAFAGTNGPILVTSGVLLTPPGNIIQEHERPPVDPVVPCASEQSALALADRGLKAHAHFGGVALFASGNRPAADDCTRQALGWEPREANIVADIERPDYSA